MRPTRLAIALTALGLPLALLPAAVHPRLWPFWPAYLGALVLLLGADALLAPRRRGIACEVDLPRLLYIGKAAEARVTVRSASARGVPVEVAVDLSDRLLPQPPLRGVASRQGEAMALPLVPTRRGAVAVERAWVRYRGPLRLMAGVARLELDRESSVVPDILPIRDIALRFETERELRIGLKIERYTGDGTEFDSLREYATGDDPRSIDWKASAHHQKPVSRQFRAERNHQVVFAIDTGRLMSEPLDGIPKLDHAVNAALLLAYVCLRAGDRAGWMTFDSRVGRYLAPQGGTRGFGLLHRAAGQAEYSEGETNFTLGLTWLGQRLSRRSLVVVFTDFVDTVTAELMVENLDRLSRRHLVVFVALRDPGLAAAAARPPDDLLELNRAVVAGELVRDREVVLRRLRRQGIHPIDAAPEQVSPRLLNTYLELKRRERI